MAIQQSIRSIYVDKKREPPIISNVLLVPVSNSISEEVNTFLALCVFRLVLRHLASSDQIVTYLPPLNLLITEFGTVYKLFKILQSQASEVNMPYVNIALWVGAAINAYKVLWNFPSKFKKHCYSSGEFSLYKESICCTL